MVVFIGTFVKPIRKKVVSGTSGALLIFSRPAAGFRLPGYWVDPVPVVFGNFMSRATLVAPAAVFFFSGR
jgi:hypothetical protein